jgi:glyoxylase-like metal-dependent hydrolase (beta-lactamase superfamily II)
LTRRTRPPFALVLAAVATTLATPGARQAFEARTWAAQPAPPPDPVVRENATVKVSEHVYVIPDANVPLVPNVGIIVGSRGTLVVDTGMGLANGQRVAREAARVGARSEQYVVSTHFHPEHALGEAAFPPTAALVRARAQQQDIDEFGLSLADTFASRSAVNKQLLEGARYRKADVIFDAEHIVDLGGVRVRLIALGPTHTRGDTVAFVEGDRVLFAGDIVMNGTFVAFASPYSSVRAWLAALDRLTPLQPARIVPSHGDMGDASLIAQDRAYLSTVQRRARELNAAGKSADEVAAAITQEVQAQFPTWTNLPRVAAAAKSAVGEVSR